MRICGSFFLMGLAMLPVPTGAVEPPTGFGEILSEYETIRLTLLADTLSGVDEHARALSEKASSWRRDVAGGEDLGPTGDRDALVAALLEVESSAVRLAESSDLDRAREEFFLLTRPLAKVRKLTGDETTIVAYCSMAQKAWIQPDGELGNPYMGQSMPRCGEVVGES